MRPPCEVVLRELIPRFRIKLVKKLSSYGWTQKDIGRLLGVSQPMVSELISSPDPMGELSREAELLAQEIFSAIRSEKNAEEIIERFCRTCKFLKIHGNLCSTHMKVYGVLSSRCTVCKIVEAPLTMKEDAFSDMISAMRMIEDNAPILMKIYPEVGINLARSSNGELKEILGVPGRIVKYRGGLRAFSGPELGASQHNGIVLEKVMNSHPKVRAIVNLRYADGLERVLEGMGLKYGRIRRAPGKKSPEVREKELLEEVERICRGEKPDVLIDPGEFGVEPAIYVLGRSAVEAVRLAIKIAGRLGDLV